MPKCYVEALKKNIYFIFAIVEYFYPIIILNFSAMAKFFLRKTQKNKWIIFKIFSEETIPLRIVSVCGKKIFSAGAIHNNRRRDMESIFQ